MWAAAVLAISDAGWTVIGGIATLLITGIAIPTWKIFVLTRDTKEIAADTNVNAKQINTAVNHVEPGTLPLVKRVGKIERANASHYAWERQAFESMALQIGIKLPDYPDHVEETDEHAADRNY